MPQKFSLFNELLSYWSESWIVHKQVLRYLLLMTFHVIELTAALKIWDEKTIIIALLHLFCEYKVTAKQISKAEVKIWSVDQGYHRMLLVMLQYCWRNKMMMYGSGNLRESWYFDLVPYCALTAKLLQTNFIGMCNIEA